MACYYCNAEGWVKERERLYFFDMETIETFYKLREDMEASTKGAEDGHDSLDNLIILVNSFKKIHQHIVETIMGAHASCPPPAVKNVKNAKKKTGLPIGTTGTSGTDGTAVATAAVAPHEQPGFWLQAISYYSGLSTDQCCTLDKLSTCLQEMEAIAKMVGMHEIKVKFTALMKFLVRKHPDQQPMMHIMLAGPPGHGKTEIAGLLGRAFRKSGLLKSDVFVKASRDQLIGAYLGQTAKATQAKFDEARGGVLFIDEVQMLGPRPGSSSSGDMYSQECIDTINKNLSERPDTLCIIAGYEDEIDERFFRLNKGLGRRFQWRFSMKKYTSKDLVEIFKKLVGEQGWRLDDGALKYTDIDRDPTYFVNAGGDMSNLVTKCIIAHCSNEFLRSPIQTISRADVLMGLKAHKAAYPKPTEDSEPPHGMYI